ncbi:hypothetical protein CYLTODRAFT_114830 [Cylindrobasidium torrendii FP15055 ss-10]|uniref:Yeast cell wall synthesis Kre9/Knh1-like N-terminal domain-containing protein n=1 Tax=Cylindrobasidium torrendii FP15055 ss-10 TaxID=1314674 RepID=A0A0D7B1M3_9AGAR|nr:hypothetical protein CYLTODRAFT_114830 [Cylindrobasidium torrendii FP15055 ss-10]
MEFFSLRPLSIFGVLALASCASAAIFPTRPVSSTVYNVGQPAVIEWTWDQPSGPMGPFRVDLFAGNDTYITTLAKNVKPSMKSYTLFLSEDIPYIGRDYTMRMISKHPKHTVFTADFTIDGVSGPDSESKSASVNSNGEPQQAFHDSTNNANGTTSGMHTMSSATSVSMSTTSTSTSASSASTVTAPALDGNSGGSAGGLSNSADASTRKVDSMNRFIAVFWPACVGVLMAL